MHLAATTAILILALFMSFPLGARADIVMINLNGSTQEVDALRRLTSKSQERLFVVPEIQGDETYDTQDLTNDLVALARQGVRPRAVVVSGHHYQDQYYYGISGKFFLHDVSELLAPYHSSADVRSFFKAVKSLYLWGCYSGTLGNTDKLASGLQTPFTDARYIMGFQKKGPLGVTRESGLLLERALESERSLRQMSPPAKVTQIKNILGTSRYDLVMHEDDNYFTALGSSNREHFRQTCISPTTLTKFARDNKALYSFFNGIQPIPENTSSGPLRQLYEDLQEYRYCLDKNNVCVANREGKQYDRLQAETAIRLVYYKNVIKNFAKIYGSRLQYVHNLLLKYGFRQSDFILRLETLDRQAIIQHLANLNLENHNLHYDPKDLAKSTHYYFVRAVLEDIRSTVYTAGALIPASWTSEAATSLGYYKRLNDFQGAFSKAGKDAKCLVYGCEEDALEVASKNEEKLASRQCVVEP